MELICICKNKISIEEIDYFVSYESGEEYTYISVRCKICNKFLEHFQYGEITIENMIIDLQKQIQ